MVSHRMVWFVSNGDVCADLPRATDVDVPSESQPIQTDDLPLVNQNDNSQSRTVVIHQDGGHVPPAIFTDEPVEMPPPYSSIPFS